MVLAHVPFAADWHTMKLKVHYSETSEMIFYPT